MTAAGKAPTVADEMAKFNGFSTNNGETVAPDDANARKGAGDRNLSDDERKAGVKIAGTDTREAATLTADEEAAAIEAATKAKGDDLTDEEADEAVAAALAEKSKPAGKKPESADERLKRAQAGRRKEAAARARAERERDDLRQRIEALEKGSPLTKGTKDDKTETADKEPDPKDFEFGEVDSRYIRALARYEAKQELAAAASKNQETQQTAEQRRAAQEAAERRSVFEDKGHELFEDFQEVVLDTVGLPASDPDAWPLSATLVNLLLDSPEQGPKVMYALASDTKEARRIAKMSPRDQERWFYKEEAKYEAEAENADAGGKGEKGAKGGTQEAETTGIRRESRAPKVPNRNKGGSHQQPVNAATTDFRAFEAMAVAASIPRR